MKFGSRAASTFCLVKLNAEPYKNITKS